MALRASGAAVDGAPSHDRQAPRSEPFRPAFESLEQRQLLSAIPLENKIIVGMITDEQGRHVNSSRVIVRFSENITLADPTKFRMFGYAANPTSASPTAQQKITINLLNIREHPDGNKIQFETDRRVRKGARFFMYDGAIKNASDGSNIGEKLVLLPKGLNKERFTLASRVFRPTDLSYFNSATFADAPAVIPASVPPSESSVAGELNDFLDARIAVGSITETQKQQALARFNDNVVKQLVPAANLRAAIVSLVGTVGESAIPALLDGQNDTGKRYTIIDFSNEVSPSAVVAETKVNDAGRLRTLIKPSFAGEPFQALSAIMAHEALHQDITNSQNEELFANVVETLVYAQQVLIDPSIASTGTQLVTTMNGMLLAMLNSGSALYPRVGVLSAPLLGGIGSVFHGGTPAGDAGGVYNSFENYVRRIYAARNFGGGDTPAPTLARTMQNAITGRADSVNFNFSQERIELFDNSQQVITDRNAVQLARILKLQIVR